MTSPSVVRPATIQDRDEVWRLADLLWEENAMFSMSPKKVKYHIDRFTDPSSIAPDDTGARGFIGVIGPVGALEGAIMIALWQPWFSEDWALDEYFNFVDPAHRSSNHFRMQIRYAKNIIDQTIPKQPDLSILIGVLSTKRTGAKVRIYGQELEACGAYFRYPPLPHTTPEPIRRLYSKAS